MKQSSRSFLGGDGLVHAVLLSYMPWTSVTRAGRSTCALNTLCERVIPGDARVRKDAVTCLVCLAELP